MTDIDFRIVTGAFLDETCIFTGKHFEHPIQRSFCTLGITQHFSDQSKQGAILLRAADGTILAQPPARARSIGGVAMPTCWHCKTETTREHFLRVVDGSGPLYGPWEGWRTAGRFLVSPDGERITCERLRGMLWAEKNRIRKTVARATNVGDLARVFLLPPRERFDGRA